MEASEQAQPENEVKAEAENEAVTGDQGQWVQQEAAQPAGVGSGDPNVPVATSPPPPAAQSGRPSPPDEGTFPSGEREDAEPVEEAVEESPIEESPQEHGAGGS